MRIASVTISNFRCFGPEPSTVYLDRLTCLIGANGSGKSAVLQALAKLFGVLPGDRSLRASDFHVPKGQQLDDVPSRSLYIEARLEFPELAEAGEAQGVPECFNQMIIEEPGALPYCRVRLEATWDKSTTAGGEIDDSQYWITTAADNFEGHTVKMRGADRSLIHVHYVPANRDPAQQIRTSSGSIMHRLLNAVEWTDALRDAVNDAAQEIREKFDAEDGVAVVKGALSGTWGQFTDGDFFETVNISPLSRRFEDILAKIEATFQPSPDGTEESPDRLSDGMRSLFYLTLVKTVFDVEERLLANQAAGISAERLAAPALTVLAIEEPENHLAPHYLAKVFATCRKMLESPRAQCAITSHSPSVLRRIDPAEVRYLRLSDDREAAVKQITLPPEQDEAFKYINQAVQAYPELYFSKVVILGEGDSEEVILPRVAEALDVPLDSSFVSVVPLGGRHVNHLWRLLDELGIPYVTLLDFDRFREGGGWGRIKYVCKQLLALGRVPREGVAADDYENMHERADDVELQKEWITALEDHRVFFSFQLDIDYLMLKAFPEAYHGLAPETGGPRIPDMGDEHYDEKVRAAFAALVKKDAATLDDLPAIQDPSALFWYRYLFLGRGKPSTHALALLRIERADLATGCPQPLRCVVAAVETILNQEPALPIEET
jgi:putative ATP-dependent endonuclease of the OLD family